MRNEDLRDEEAQDFADGLLDNIEEMWQGVHATEEPYDNLANDYYTGMADMVLRIANCLIDEVRERCARQPGMADVAREVADMKVPLKGREE